MKKHSLRAVLFLMAIGILFQSVLRAQSTQAPEQRVTAFYTWFVKNDTDQTFPLNLADIYRYVAKNTVDRLKSEYAYGGAPQGVDYFLKVQDYDRSDWLAHIAARPAIMLGDVAVVAVTFGAKRDSSVLVFLRRQDGVWKIIKVDDTQAY